MQRAWQIRDYDEARDAAALHACFAELQDFERALEPDLPPGAEVASAYLPLLFERCARWRGRIFVAAQEDGRVVGFAAVQAAVPQEEPDDPPGCYALLSDLVVLPEARRSGLGRALLERAEAYARAEGAQVLSLAVLARNAGARSLYAAAGFRERFLQLEKRLVPAGGGRP
jgi:ribosomal protein S18 acetylase RimI-like enzyme